MKATLKHPETFFILYLFGIMVLRMAYNLTMVPSRSKFTTEY